MKYFKLHWLDGKTEIIKGSKISEAFANAGYGGGALNALDYHEEITELPIEEKTIYVNGSEVFNPSFIEQMRKFLSNNPKSGTVQVNYANRIFKYVLVNQTGTEAFFA